MCPFGAQERDGAETEHSVLMKHLPVSQHWSLSLWSSQGVCVYLCVCVCVRGKGWERQLNTKLQWIMMSIVICEAQGAAGGNLN